MYYIIERHYIGPTMYDVASSDYKIIEISTRPERGKSDNEIKIDCWCNSTGGYAVYAHGSYQSQELAEMAIKDEFANVRDTGNDNVLFESDDPHIVKIYKTSNFSPIN